MLVARCTTIALLFLFVKNLTAQDDYTLVWSDEFNNSGSPDSTNWNYEKGFMRNEEFQWYQPDNARCENGMLIVGSKKRTKAKSVIQTGR